jgi:hypothetical protein
VPVAYRAALGTPQIADSSDRQVNKLVTRPRLRA